MNDARVLAALRPVAALFDRLGIVWHIGGSVASATFGVARSTLDVDLAADVQAIHAEPIAHALRGDYYADAELILDAVRHRSCFNLLYLKSYFKVDVFVPADTVYARTALCRSVPGVLRDGGDAATFPFATAEDVILHKLEWWRAAAGSDRQWSDLLGLLRAQRARLDMAYLQKWADALGLADELTRLIAEGT
jgi:hypothetical protein